MFYVSQLFLWLVQTHSLRRLYPSHGWHMLSHQIKVHGTKSQSNIDLLSLHDVISIKFLLTGKLMLVSFNTLQYICYEFWVYDLFLQCIDTENVSVSNITKCAALQLNSTNFN